MFSTKKICYAAVLTALTVCLCSFGVPMPGGGHLYLVDASICFAALVLDPLSAFIVGGVGSFLGDLFFYPAAMFVSLAAHGLQAASISLIVAGKNVKKEGFLRVEKRRLPRTTKVVLALVVGSLVMVTGYTLGSAFIYGTKETALVKIPGQTLQSCVGSVLAAVCAFSKPLKDLFFSRPAVSKDAAAEQKDVTAASKAAAEQKDVTAASKAAAEQKDVTAETKNVTPETTAPMATQTTMQTALQAAPQTENVSCSCTEETSCADDASAT